MHVESWYIAMGLLGRGRGCHFGTRAISLAWCCHAVQSQELSGFCSMIYWTRSVSGEWDRRIRGRLVAYLFIYIYTSIVVEIYTWKESLPQPQGSFVSLLYTYLFTRKLFCQSGETYPSFNQRAPQNSFLSFIFLNFLALVITKTCSEGLWPRGQQKLGQQMYRNQSQKSTLMSLTPGSLWEVRVIPLEMPPNVYRGHYYVLHTHYTSIFWGMKQCKCMYGEI